VPVPLPLLCALLFCINTLDYPTGAGGDPDNPAALKQSKEPSSGEEPIGTEPPIVAVMGGPALHTIGADIIGYCQHVLISYGTCRGYIFDPTTKKRYGLSNGHVAVINLAAGCQGRWRGGSCARLGRRLRTQKKDELENLAQAVELD